MFFFFLLIFACSQRTYVGINASSVKCIWEQYNKSDIELNSEVLPILAEDTSYKLWELINNLKTFTRHSGGKLTTSIVNELLKDCDVPPAVGAHATHKEWKRFDCDGTFYYQDDDVIDLREEYLKETTITQMGPLMLEANWVSNQRNFKDLNKLWQSIMLAIVLGDDAAFQYTIHTTLINPFIGCILPQLVQKTIEYLAFSYTDDTLDRLLRFLKVLVQNYHSRDVANDEEYFNLCNLFVCLLLGNIDMKSKLAIIQMERAKLEKSKKMKSKDGDAGGGGGAVAGSTVTATKTTVPPTTSTEATVIADTPPESLVRGIKTEFIGPKDIQDVGSGEGSSAGVGGVEGGSGDSENVIIKDESEYSNNVYRNIGVNPVAKYGFSIKTETPDDQRFFDCDTDMKFDGYNEDYADGSMFDATKRADIKTETTEPSSAEKCSTLLNGDDIHTYCNEVFSPFVTVACSDRFVDEVCKLIGYLAGKWGYFEHETTYLLAKRLEIFFFEDHKRWSTREFKWLARITQALSALGETAFRELTIYFEYIPYERIPEWLIPYFSYGSIYVRGRKDFYFYEYMQEVCGDSLIPFLVYYPKYMEKLRERIKAKQKNKQHLESLKINSKTMLKFIERTNPSNGQNGKSPTIGDFFPERTSHIRKIAPSTRRIGFKFAGCCPVLAKSTIKLSAEQQFVQSFDLCNKLNKRIVICRRKLLKPIYINKHADLSYLTDHRQDII